MLAEPKESKRLAVYIVTAVLPPNYGGADIAALRYAQSLSQLSSIGVRLLGEQNKSVENNTPPIDTLLLPIALHKSFHWRGYLKYISDYINLFNTIAAVFTTLFKNRRHFDLIHCFNSSSNICIAAILSGKILGKPIITETSLMNSDDPVTLLKGKGFKRLAKIKWLKGRLFLLANHYISKSKYITAAYQKMKLIHRCTEIPYFIDTTKFYPANEEDKKNLRLKHGLPPDATIILFVGGINPRKGVHLLVEAFQQLMATYPSAFLLLVGPTNKYKPDYPTAIKASLAQVGADKSKLIEGNSVHVDEFMRAADIYCLPSFREGFPISNIEAMASGLVVVASDIPEIKDTQIRDNENGLIFKTGSSQALAHKLERALGDQDLCRRLIECAAAEARTKYDLTKIQQQYLDIYQSLVS